MDEKRKFSFTVLLGIAGVFLLMTRFCLPMLKDNKEYIEQYGRLVAEVEFIESFKKGELDLIEEKMENAINYFEEKIPTEGKLKLTEQLTRASLGGNIALKAITRGDFQEMEDYQIILVNVDMKAPFEDFVKYLAAIESNSLFIDVDSLTMRRVDNKPGFLDIEVTFSGFKLTHQFQPISKYLEGEYEPLNMGRLNNLLEKVQLKDSQRELLSLKDHNPFVSIYDLEPPVAQEEVLPQFAEVEEEEIPAEEEEILPDPEDILKSLLLRGILNIGEEKAALINDTIVKKGEIIADMQVVEIKDYKVILMHSDRNFTLKMGVDNEIVEP